MLILELNRLEKYQLQIYGFKIKISYDQLDEMLSSFHILAFWTRLKYADAHSGCFSYVSVHIVNNISGRACVAHSYEGRNDTENFIP